jgi:addiction module HigA family antidote
LSSTIEELSSLPDLPVNRPIARAPTHPGELMREILDEHLHLSTAEAARRMKIPAAGLSASLRGAKSVTADMALRFGRLTGGAPELYVQMQAQYDLWTARERLKEALASIEPAA